MQMLAIPRAGSSRRDDTQMAVTLDDYLHNGPNGLVTGIGHAPSLVCEHHLGGIPRALALAPLDDRDPLAHDVDVGIPNVVLLVHFLHVILGIDDDLQDVVAVAAAAEVDVLAGPLPAVDIAPADVETEAGSAGCVPAVGREGV